MPRKKQPDRRYHTLTLPVYPYLAKYFAYAYPLQPYVLNGKDSFGRYLRALLNRQGHYTRHHHNVQPGNERMSGSILIYIDPDTAERYGHSMSPRVQKMVNDYLKREMHERLAVIIRAYQSQGLSQPIKKACLHLLDEMGAGPQHGLEYESMRKAQRRFQDEKTSEMQAHAAATGQNAHVTI